MFQLDQASARITEGGLKYAETAQDDSTRRVLKTDLKVSVDLTEAVIAASEVIVPFLGKVCDLVAGEENCTGLDVKARAKLPVCAVTVDALDPKSRKKNPAFHWNAVEVRGKPLFKIDKEGEGTLELVFRVTTTKTDMQRLVDWLDADAVITVERSDDAGPGLDDDPQQVTLAEVIDANGEKQGATEVKAVVVDGKKTRGQKALEAGKTIKTVDGEADIGPGAA